MRAEVRELLPGRAGEVAELLPGRAGEVAELVGEIVTPWRLSDYVEQLDNNIMALSVDVMTRSFPGFNGFDIVGWNAFVASWKAYKESIGIVDEWVNPGETWNRVEKYHNDYKAWRAKAAAAGLADKADPMPKPQPYQENPGGGILESVENVVEDVAIVVVVVGGLYLWASSRR